MMFRKTYASLFLIAGHLFGQTQVDLRTQSKGVDFQAAPYTRPLKSSATLPATCTPNELLLLTSAPQGANIYACLSQDSWVPEAGSAAQAVTVQNSGVPIGVRGTENFVAGLGIANAITDLGGKINVQQSVDTASILSRATHQSGQTLLCQPASASPTAYTCDMSPTLTGYTSGMVLYLRPDITATGGPTTLDIDTLGPVAIKESDGVTDPSPAELLVGRLYGVWFDGAAFRLMAVGSGGGGGGVTLPLGPPNQVLATDAAGASQDLPALRALVPADIPAETRRRGFQVVFAGSDLTVGGIVYVTLPYACTASGYLISADPAGTATLSLWKIADGTTLPGSANSISTSGFSLSSGNRIHSSNLTDLTTLAWSPWDTTAVVLTAVSGNPNHVTFGLECDQ